MLRVIAIALIVVTASVVAFAQKKTCNLKLKVFSYDVVDSPKRHLLNVDVTLKGKGRDLKQKLTGDSLNDQFKDLNDGTYRVEFQKSGFKKRSKLIEVDCGIADNENTVGNYTYLWRDKSRPTDEADLVIIDEKGGSAKSAGSNVKASFPNKIGGIVPVKILIDEDGNVIEATAIDGPKELRVVSIKAARGAKFSPTLLSGEPVKVTGVITYNFVP